MIRPTRSFYSTAHANIYLLGYLLIVVLCVGFPLTTKGTITTLPFTEVNGLILLEATIDHRKGDLILDTGADGLVLNQACYAANRLGSATGVGAFGEVEVGLASVRQLLIGDLVLRPGRACVTDLSHLNLQRENELLGLLGYSALKDYAITIDYRAGTVVFTDEDGPATVHPYGVDSFPFTLTKFLPVIEVRIGGIPFWMGIDTGARYNLLKARRASVLREHYRQTNSIRVLSSDGKMRLVRVGRLKGVLLGDQYRCSSMQTLLMDLSPLERVYGTRLDGILGTEFLAPWIFTINYRTGMLYVNRFAPRCAPDQAPDPGTLLVSSQTDF